MITVKQALESPRAKLTERELTTFQFVEAKITAAIGDMFTGQPFDVPMALADVPVRVVYAIKRRFEKPAEDGSRWVVTVDALMDSTSLDAATAGEPLLVGHRLRFEPAPPSDFLAPKPVAEAPRPAVLTQLFGELAALHGRSIDESRTTLSAAPQLSILFGTYNRLDHLRAAVASVRRAVGHWTYEIVVCDGGSTDGSREWLSAQRDVVLVGDRHLTGAVVAFNHCWRMSRGQFIANLNDDMTVEGTALAEGVAFLEAHPEVGQIAFAFRGEGEQWTINDIYPKDRYPKVTWPTTYANFGVARRSAVEQVAAITGGFWNPIYRTYAADCELSAWLWKLGWRVEKLPHLRVVDVRVEDGLRAKNSKDSGLEAKRMYARWPAEAFQPNGPDPRVTPEELERFRRVRGGEVPVVSVIVPPPPADMTTTVAELIGWPEPGEEARQQRIGRAIRALDPSDTFPRRAPLERERVLHVSLCTDADPQAGLVRALRAMGADGYEEVRWYADHPDHDERQRAILDAARTLKPTIVFMQLQTDGAVDVETVRELRHVADPACVIATWNGDISLENSPYHADWQVTLGRAVDLTLHSSMGHVRVFRAAGIHSAAYLQIGYDEEQYRPAPEPVEKSYDVCFLGSRYPEDSAFAKAMTRHDGALRDEVVIALKRAFGDRFGLFGRGWAALLADHGMPHVDQVVPLNQAHTIYWRSRFGLSVSLANDLECYSSDRLHRVLACGAIALVKRFPGMETWGLVHGKNCLVWDTAGEAVALASAEAFDDPAAGARLAGEHLTWAVRVEELQAIVNAARGTR